MPVSVLCLIANPAEPAIDDVLRNAVHKAIGGEINVLNQRIAVEFVKPDLATAAEAARERLGWLLMSGREAAKLGDQIVFVHSKAGGPEEVSGLDVFRGRLITQKIQRIGTKIDHVHLTVRDPVCNKHRLPVGRGCMFGG